MKLSPTICLPLIFHHKFNQRLQLSHKPSNPQKVISWKIPLCHKYRTNDFSFPLKLKQRERKNCIQILWHSATPKLSLWPWARKPLAEKEETQKDINTSRKRRRKPGKQREYCLGAKKCIITAICIRLSKKRMANETTAECASKSNE